MSQEAGSFLSHNGKIKHVKGKLGLYLLFILGDNIELFSGPLFYQSKSPPLSQTSERELSIVIPILAEAKTALCISSGITSQSAATAFGFVSPSTLTLHSHG